MRREAHEQKAVMRRDVRARLAKLGEDERAADSRAIVDAIAGAAEYERAQTIMLFRGLADEPNVDALAEAAMKAGKQVCFPLMDWSAHEMAPAVVTSLSEGWLARRHGIAEPVTAPIIEIDALDLVCVPGVAFDRRGGRLGRGAGFYDRFLAKLEERAWGVCFECQLVDSVPLESHDVRLGAVVTARALYRCP